MLEKLQRLAGAEHVYANEPMKNHTTFRVGGAARWLVEPQTAETLWGVMETCREENVPCYVVGNGSNLLVSDKGYDGVILHLFKNMSETEVHGTKITLQAGALLMKASRIAMGKGLTGLEFASGIPGTMGGAVVIEVIFALPGMGTLIQQGITGGEIMLVQGVVVVVALAFVIINIVVDMLYLLINPRIRTV